MAAKRTAKAETKHVNGERVTIEVLVPHDGLVEGYRREIAFSARVQYMIDNNYWKIV